MEDNPTYTLRKQWNDACLSVGIPALTIDTCARIMAVLYRYGNNEAFTLSGHFNADREYIQQRFHLRGGEIPDARFAVLLQRYVKELEEYERTHRSDYNAEHFGDPKPQWCRDLFMKMYQFKV